MKVGIITFQQTNNYGAILQNYALQKAITKLGHEVETIDYRAEYISKPYKWVHLKRKGIFSYAFGVAGYICYLPRTSNCNRFRKLIRYSEPCSANNIKKNADLYDVYIAGSDQVWNYRLIGEDENYLLSFVINKKKCNSFAASIGLSEIEPSKMGFYKSMLEQFNIITVREKKAEQLLNHIIEHKIDVVSDPCILLTKEEWLEVARKSEKNKKSPYILVYQLGISTDLIKIAQTLAKNKGLKIVFVPFPVGKFARGKWEIFAGPGELIRYINDAEYVMTDSFHGTLFSILFNKKFLTKVAGTHEGVGSRIYDLLERYGLLERLISKNVDIENSINYKEINKQIKYDRECAQAILNNICSKK